MMSLAKELSSNTYPGRGIVIGRSGDGKYAVTAYFIMGRSENSRNRVFVEDGEGIRTQAFDPSKLTDPESHHLCTGPRAWQQDDRDKRRSDRYDLRTDGQAADVRAGVAHQRV